MAFLSLLDDRAKPKGSRDPLGFELIWTHYGRRVISNLTTITSSLDNFAVALLGFHWANEIHATLSPAEKQSEVRKTFLCYEQLAAYLRYRAGNGDIMGITRVRQRMDDPPDSIRLGLGPEQQILSDQTGYGLWGFYSNAMRDSGLIEGEARTPTANGEAIAAAIEAKLPARAATIDAVRKQRVSRDTLDQLGPQYLEAIQDADVRAALLERLLGGGSNNQIPQEVFRIAQMLANDGVLPDAYPAFVDKLETSTDNQDLRARLSDIKALERLLVSANNIFHYCCRKDGVPLQNVIDELDRQNYSYAHIREQPDLHAAPRAGSLLAEIRNAFLQGDTKAAVRTILALNRYIMEQRDGAPWVEVEQDQSIRVRVPSETAELRSQKALENDWDYDYFMASYLAIAREALS